MFASSKYAVYALYGELIIIFFLQTTDFSRVVEQMLSLTKFQYMRYGYANESYNVTRAALCNFLLAFSMITTLFDNSLHVYWMFLPWNLSTSLNSEEVNITNPLNYCVINFYIQVIDISISRREYHILGLWNIQRQLITTLPFWDIFKSPFNLAHISCVS